MRVARPPLPARQRVRRELMPTAGLLHQNFIIRIVRFSQGRGSSRAGPQEPLD